VADASAAQAATGLALELPAHLPPGVTGAPTFMALPAVQGTFTFSETSARQHALATGHAVPSFPPGIDRSQLLVSLGPAEAAVYGLVPGAEDGPENLPQLAVAAGRAPTVSSSGLTVSQLEDFLLAQPGISSRLASELRAMGDPYSTLPIFIPADMATAKRVSVEGTQGLLIGDDTGLGSGVIWESGGIVHAVVGTATQAQIMAVADSLHQS
jgi:hypothetical protein